MMCCLKRALAVAFGVILLQASCRASEVAQETLLGGQTPETTIRISTNLVLVDVMALNATDGSPDETLTRDDFKISDDGHGVPIKTFDTGLNTRPLALWFLVQCRMKGWETQGSGVFAHQIGQFTPTLTTLDKRDTVAVAHWCDDGQSQLDLLPTNKVEAATTTLEQVLEPISDPHSHTRSGELALQKTLQAIIDATRSLPTETIPVVIFLYDDYSAMPKPEIDRFVGQLLETSTIVYGLKDSRSPKIMSFRLLGGEQGAVANYIAKKTGGQYFAETPDAFATGLEQILRQLRSRYELGFRPIALDGKRHTLRVVLAKSARRRNKTTRLQYRDAYVPRLPPGVVR